MLDLFLRSIKPRKRDRRWGVREIRTRESRDAGNKDLQGGACRADYAAHYRVDDQLCSYIKP